VLPCPNTSSTNSPVLLARCYFKQGRVGKSNSKMIGARSAALHLLSFVDTYLHQKRKRKKTYCTLISLPLIMIRHGTKHGIHGALANFEVIGYLDNQTESRTVDFPGNGLAAHIVQAVGKVGRSHQPDSFLMLTSPSFRIFPLNRSSK